MLSTLRKRVIVEKEYGIDGRDEFLRDRDRILFSRAFRRLAFKTQVVTVSSKSTSDHIRSRLTHSLEVMQIASSIALNVNKKIQDENNKEDSIKKEVNLNLVQAIALGHDLGHAPYGHVGEEALYNFVFGDYSNLKHLNSKLKHCFQSLKVCCFLEKHYMPDFYGLNLTLATLDGIFKHSKLSEDELKFYKRIFDHYCEIFWHDVRINSNVLYDLKDKLFNYISPVTPEGAIISIADEIAQMCHDVEDLRRIGGPDVVKDIYETAKDEIENLIDYSKVPTSNNDLEGIKKLYNDFIITFNEVKECRKEHIIKLERLYVKLILKLAISTISDVIKSLVDMDWTDKEVF